MRTIQEIQQKDEKLSIGLISGTSLDGVDAALVRIKKSGLETKVELIYFMTLPYPRGLKEKLLEISTAGNGSVDDICRFNVVLGEIFADAVKVLLNKAGVKSGEVDFIGSHGQTVHHLPKAEKLFNYSITSTLQLGEPSIISRRTDILIVADFRPADMALGGQGAPMAPYLDFTLFRSLEKGRALLNIGGIANFTILEKDCSLNNVIAFDTGPGNMVIDFLMNQLFSRPFDENGEIASSGRISEQLLNFALKHPYFKKLPPKSTGREEFGAVFCEYLLTESERLSCSKKDIIATASELTVRSIMDALKNFVAPKVAIDEMIISGGGTENRYIMEGLGMAAETVSVKAIDEYGIPSAAKEAIIFAVLANETICGNPSNVPSTTGAKEATILGKICF